MKEIDSGLESLQHEVGGYIEAIYPYEEPVALVCNEEGKLEGLPLNRALRDEDGDIYDVVAGTFMVWRCFHRLSRKSFRAAFSGVCLYANSQSEME